MLDYCVYLLYRAALAAIALLPLSIVFQLGKIAGSIAWLLLPKYRRLARHNVEIAFGEKDPRAVGHLVRRHFRQLGANLLSSMKLNGMPMEQVVARVAAEGLNAVHEVLKGGRGGVFVLSHLGNWELFTQIFPHHFGYVRLSTVYQRLGNRHIDAFVRQQRARGGIELFDRSEGFQKAIQLLRNGGVIGILSDQHAGDHGMWTPFFGRLASTSPLAALLCKRTGAALFAGSVSTVGEARWRMIISPRLDHPSESVQSLTAKANVTIEGQIRREPEDWFWVHNRWKTPRPDFLLSKYKRGIYLPSGMDKSALQPFRILIRSSNWLGDSVISMPAVRAIKAGRPDAHITVLAPAKIAAVWRLVPEVDEVLAFSKPSLLATVRLLRQQKNFDVGIVFPNSPRVALELWLAGVPRRVGYRGRWRSALLNQIVPKPLHKGPPLHQVEHYLQIARSLGVEANAQLANPPRRAPGPLRIGLCPGAEYGPAKRWLPERFAEVAAAIASHHAARWILFGTAKDAEIGTAIENSLGDSCVNRIGQTTLEQLIEELRECRLLLTNDTGTMHLATLLGVPVVAVFGSTEPRLTGPLGRGNIVLRHQVECSPCFLRECPIDFRCMKAVSTAEVEAAVEKILATTNGETPDALL